MISGQEVIYHRKPIESLCPHCKTIYGTSLEGEYEATVIRPHDRCKCMSCGEEFNLPQGWYEILVPAISEYRTIIAPHTLLEVVEDNK